MEGKIEGKMEGKIEGKFEGKLESLMMIISKKFKNVPEDTLTKISKITDVILIEKILDEIFEINSEEELERYF
jgi:hypothetical protein